MQFMDAQDATLLSKIYSRVEDIDLLLGGLLEIPTEGAAVGPTFVCLLRQQLVKLRNSDRFWYENDIPPSSLTPAQITEIRKVSLSGIICSNSGISKIQPKSFIQQDPYLNVKINCDQHGLLDVSAWREEHIPDAVPDNHMTTTVATDSAMSFISEINEEMIASAIKKAEQDLQARKQLEYNAWLEQRIADPKSPAGTAASFSKANKDALLLANSSILYELATNELINGIHGFKRRKRQAFDSGDNVLGFPNTEFNDILQNVDISGFIPRKHATNHEEVECAPDNSPCDPTTPYRTFSGHCNNLRNPSLAKSLTTFARLLPPVYEDGVSKPKVTSITGNCHSRSALYLKTKLKIIRFTKHYFLLL